MDNVDGLVVGIEIGGDGVHPAAWLDAAHPPSTLLTAERMAGIGRTVDAAGFGFATLDDVTPDGPGPDVTGRFDPVTAAAYLSAHTSSVGLVPVVHPAHAEPFHVSNQLSSLDHASRGRAGWLVGTEATAARASAHGERHERDPRILAEEAVDVVDAARLLWDSWQDDAIVADHATGRFLDADRVHHVDFTGRTFSVRGPALLPRPPQGQVVVMAPASWLPDGRTDVGTITARTWPEVVRAAAAAPEATLCAEIEVLLDADLSARERLAGLDRYRAWPPGPRLRHVGSPGELVDRLRELTGYVDAVRLLPATLDRDLPVLADVVLPALGASLRRPGPDRTLRDLLGLPRPAGRFVARTR